MTHLLLAINALVCTATCLRLILFNRENKTHRPRATLLAYVLIVSSGGIPLFTLLGLLTYVSYPQFFVNLVLCVAIFAVRGNVIELFRFSDSPDESKLTRWLRSQTWI